MRPDTRRRVVLALLIVLTVLAVSWIIVYGVGYALHYQPHRGFD